MNTRYFYWVLIKLEFSRQILEKSSNIKFHENQSCRIQAVPCGRTEVDRQTRPVGTKLFQAGGRTDGHEVNSPFS